VYGPYENVAADATSELVYHFESKAPFLTVTNIVREVEVSHWGNVAITEDITMQHTGAKLKVCVCVCVCVSIPLSLSLLPSHA
jgi:oligosaccharyltransferase complex subunit alpha (ribophorin I)